MKVYDLLVIGGGFSSVTCVSNCIRNGFLGQIAILESGRKLGGRSSLKTSRKYKDWNIHHGSPNFNIVEDSKDSLISNFIQYLISNNLIVIDDSYFFELDKSFDISSMPNNDFYKGVVYKSCNSMSDMLLKLIKLIDLKENVDIFPSTTVIDLEYLNNEWRLKTIHGVEFHCKYLVMSSNLLLHNRSKRILSTNNIPMNNVLKKNNNTQIYQLIKAVNKQKNIIRRNFIIYTHNNYRYKLSELKKDINFFLNNEAEERIGIERIVFQKQPNNNLGIVVHTKVKDIFDLESNTHDEFFVYKDLINRLNEVFKKNKLINQLNEYKDISTMNWRSSQPLAKGINRELQVCKELNISFCGDWFDYKGFGRVEGAILSGISLSNKLINLI